MGLVQKHADHEAKTVREPSDDGSLIIAAYAGDELVGTVRHEYSGEATFGEYMRMFRMEEFAPFFPTRVSLATKLIVRKDFRSSSVAARLTKRLFQEGLRRNMSFDFICCYDETRDFFKRLGYRQVFGDIAHPEYGSAHPMVLAYRDKAYLDSIRSPFAALIAEEEVESDSVALFQGLLGSASRDILNTVKI
jgi:hypothetical protein